MRPMHAPGSYPAIAAAVTAAALIGAGFAGWLGQGARMFASLAETGLAWCF